MGTDDLPPNPLKQALSYNTPTQIHVTNNTVLLTAVHAVSNVHEGLHGYKGL